MSGSGWALVATAASPTLIVCLLASVGVILAKKGVLTPAGCQLLARVSFLVFTPALTFTKLAQAVSLESVRHLWPLLLNMTVGIVAGLALGLAACRLLRAPREFRAHTLVCIAFGNVGQLPLVFTSALCHDRGAIFYQSLGDSCERLGIAYTAFNIAVATLWQFTLAINLLRRSAAAAAAAAAGDAEQPGTPTGSLEDGHLPLSGRRPALHKQLTLSDLLAARRGSGAASAASSQPPSPAPEAEPLPRRPGASPLGAEALAAPALYSPQQQQQQPPGALELQPQARRSPAADEDTAALLGGQRGAAPGNGAAHWEQPGGGGGSAAARWARAARRQLAAVEWGQVLHMPIVAAVVGCVVGCIPPAKALFYGPRPPLGLVTEALEALAQGLIPVSLPLLGAVLSRGPGASRLPLRVTLGVLAARLVLLPALLTALVTAALALRLFASPDPMFLLTLLMSNATPTAINIQNMAVLYGTGEAEVSTILFLQYLASIATLPAWVTLFQRIILTWG